MAAHPARQPQPKTLVHSPLLSLPSLLSEAFSAPGRDSRSLIQSSHLAVTSLLNKQDLRYYPNTALLLFLCPLILHSGLVICARRK